MNDVSETLKERGARYGTLMDNGMISQHFKHLARTGEALVRLPANADTPRKLQTSWRNMSADQRQALDVIFDKISRILTGDPDYDDNWRDIAGYATLVLNRLTEGK